MKLKPWQYAILPVFAVSLAFLAAGYFIDENWAIWAAFPFVLSAAGYILSPQIDFWWYERHPPALNPKIQQFIDDYFLFYQKLSPELKQRFRNRLSLYLLGNEFIRPVHPDHPDAAVDRTRVPEDLKAAVAAQAVQVTFGREKYLSGKFENIIIYPHPFPTPQYGDAIFHTSEIYEPDGVVIFASDPLMAGFNNPKGFFSIGLYEYARIFKILNPSVSFPKLGENSWADLEKISGMNQNLVESVIGLPNLDLIAVATHHFFTFPERFHEVLPDVYQILTNIFNQNPANGLNPILGKNESLAKE